jgi:hypothetical protein
MEEMTYRTYKSLKSPHHSRVVAEEEVVDLSMKENNQSSNTKAQGERLKS